MPGVFPTLTTARVDSSQFQVSVEDPAMRTEMEGGYVITRAKHMRTPRKTFRVSYRLMPNVDKTALEMLWNSMRGGSDYFTWTSPQDGVVYTVRFKEPMQFQYVGRGSFQLWDCLLVLEQA